MPRHRNRPSLIGRLARYLGIASGLLIGISVLLVLPLRWCAPPTTAFMLQDRSGRVPVSYEWTDWSALGTSAALAVVAAEDQNFAEHFGFDLGSIEDALRGRASGSSFRGASTISQQVAKNLYLWPGKTFVRKGIEAWFTLLIELFWSKKRILEVYLNIAEFGPGLYGVTPASRAFFDKSPAALTTSEAALLAAVLPSPKRLNAGAPSAYLLERRQWIAGHAERMGREAWLQRISPPPD